MIRSRGITVLAGATVVDSNWLTFNSIGPFQNPTLTVEGMEAGATLSIFVTNQAVNESVPFPPDTITGVPHPSVPTITANSAVNLGNAFAFYRFKVTRGGSPSSTFAVGLFGIAEGVAEGGRQ